MFWIIVVFCLLFDQITKIIISANMIPGESIPVIDGFFHITYVLNEGASFSILQGQRYFFVILTIIVLAIVIVLLRYIPKDDKIFRYSIAVFIAGTLGNFIDRVRQGAVIDFIDFRVFPIWNVADSLLVISLIIIAIKIIISDKDKKKDE